MTLKESELPKIIKEVEKEVGRIIVGQKETVRGIMRAVLCNGHVLVEGVPGIAKTLMIRAISEVLGCEMQRIQFTVDLLPTDITGITTYSPNKGFGVVKGPVFANFIIADEINRSPPKCVLGDTPVITENGLVLDIKDLIEKYSGSEAITDSNESWIKPKEPLRLMALDLNDYKIKPEEVEYLYKQKTKSPYFNIELKTGRKVKTSSVHPFFTLKNGRVEMIEANQLKEGDCVLVPKRLDIQGSDELIYDPELVKQSEEVCNEIKRRKEIYTKIQELKNSGLSKKEIAKHLNFQESDPLLNTFLRLEPNYFKYLKEDRFFSKSKQFGQVSSVIMPKQVTKELAQFMAILISEGCINNNSFYLTMKEPEVPNLFIKSLGELFGIKANLLWDSTRSQYRVAFRSDALISLLRAIGFNPNLKSKDKEIPAFIMRASGENIKEFLKLYYEGDGCVSRDCVKVTTKSTKIANSLSYLLLRLGFVAKINRELSKTHIGNYKYCRKFYNLRLYGSELSEFYKKIKFFTAEKNEKLCSLIRNSCGEKADLIPGMHEMIRAIRKLSGITHKEFFSQAGVHAHNLENPNNSLMHSRYRLGKVSQLLGVNTCLIEQLGKIVESDFYCDFVKKAEKIEPDKEYWLYDFCMNENHSFIAGFGGIISHNTQSALLEAMQERTVTIARKTYELPKPFFVLATENPIEVSGVYSLPEAQIDRFIFKLLMGYTSHNEEIEILSNNVTLKEFEDYHLKKVLSAEKIIKLQEMTKKVLSSDAIKEYIVKLVEETRNPNFEFAKYISFGASPRASISLYIASKAEALLNGRKYVVPKDVKVVAASVLRHRIILNYEAEAEKISTDKIIENILEKVKAP